MSDQRGNPDLTKLSPESTRSPQKLAASRWAPGGTEDQLDSQKVANSNASIDATIDDTKEASTNKPPTPTAKGIFGSRWAADATEPNQTGPEKQTNANKKKTGGNKGKAKAHKKKNPNATLPQPLQGNNNNSETTSTTDPEPAQRRIIGPLSEEEQVVKVENPFFDPEKHKGLSSSRWAQE